MPETPDTTTSKTPVDSLPVDGASAEKTLATFQLPRGAGMKILGAGTELKSTVCFMADSLAMLSDPIGNLTEPGTYRQYLDTIDRLREQIGFAPDVVAHDQHPQYMSTKYAQGLGIPCVPVQHHHAHIVAVMAEWRRDKPAVGICCDGVGYGSDGAAWGCEVMKASPEGFTRLGHLDYFPLVGGDAAAVENHRPAAALLAQAYGNEWLEHLPPAFRQIDESDVEMVARLMKANLNTPMTSSLGRVFDGVSFLLGLCLRNEHEAQAPVALEQAAGPETVEPYPYGTTASNGAISMSLAPTIRAIVQDLRRGEEIGTISARFHETVARMLSVTAEMACEMTGVATTILAGGCFFNQRLCARLTRRLEQRHLTVLQPRRLSFSDAGVALGQVVVAAAMQERAS